jgi:predicted neuraminidase
MREFHFRILIILVGASLTVTSWFGLEHPQMPTFVTAQSYAKSTEPYYAETSASSQQTAKVHAAAVHAQTDGIAAYWFGGSREGASDVAIYQAFFRDKGWTKPSVIANRETLQGDLNRYIRKLGNPVSVQFDDGTIWVFFVSVSLGGWAGSAINLIESTDQGKSFSPARRLVTSPFLNVSTLVRSPPVIYEDGTIGLPVYHEFIAKFAELIRINRDAKIISKSRITSASNTLQPTVVATGAQQAIALLRYAGKPPKQLMIVDTEDGGRTWQHPRLLALPNPDAAVAAIAVNDMALAVLNNSSTLRNDLSLAVSIDDNWRVVHQLEFAEPETLSEFSYPAMTRDTEGVVHILYTWNRKRIKHIAFNETWLDQQLQ